MGKSASGKDKIYSRLAGNKELNLKKLILYTTRPVRDGEENGKQYYFTDEKKLQEFASYNDNLEEVFENREQIEISRYYEKLPKPTLIAAQEYEEGKVYFRNPAKEKEKLQ